MTAFRGHGFSLLGRKPLPAGSSDTCYSRRTRKAPEAFTSHEENWFVFSRSQRSSAPNNHHNSESKQYSTVAKYHFSEENTRRLLEKKTRFFCVRCISKKPSLSCEKAKRMRTRIERSLRVRRLIASPRKA